MLTLHILKKAVRITLLSSLVTMASISCSDKDEPVVQLPPTITGYNPTGALLGASVIISGTNFGTDANNVTVYFYEDAEATITAITDTQLTVTIPDNAYVGAVRVLVGDKEVEGGSFDVYTICTVFINGFPQPFPCPRTKPGGGVL